ncbi:hypothetical protein Tsubulata_038271 [Turnera subulata]|uniref:Pentacotripeptide-repeat region of PRORP domain-containing protein n=1 Tax=Turnera subulata TaxID=218843 RepID=A0A9Q0J891_9ROSI|nr:hypothetical protein Tsubulata_038271 [Turnera subulata]
MSATACSLYQVGYLNFKRFRVLSHQTDPTNPIQARKIFRDQIVVGKSNFVDCASLIHSLSYKRAPHIAYELLQEIKSERFLPNNSTLSAMMLCYANNGLITEAQAVWEEILHSSFVPSIPVIAELFDAYGKMGRYDEVSSILDQLSFRNFEFLPKVYSLAISCFGEGGQLELMEATLKKLASRGFLVDSATGNAVIQYYCIFGSLDEVESIYRRLKGSRHLIEEEAIRAMALLYIKEKKFYRLGEFLRNVGLARKNVGNLLWNLLLLSYAGNFKMKTLQREFLRMVEAGFHPDLTTFNIRALAFSRMALFWDLHLTLEHMNRDKVVPDLVTYGCVVDVYLDKRLGRNLDFALNKMSVDDSPVLFTDPLVFEVFGKGDFHSSSEAFMEFTKHKKWSYRKLIAVYLRKHYRSHQIFWNY